MSARTRKGHDTDNVGPITTMVRAKRPRRGEPVPRHVLGVTQGRVDNQGETYEAWVARCLVTGRANGGAGPDGDDARCPPVLRMLSAEVWRHMDPRRTVQAVSLARVIRSGRMPAVVNKLQAAAARPPDRPDAEAWDLAAGIDPLLMQFMQHEYPLSLWALPFVLRGHGSAFFQLMTWVTPDGRRPYRLWFEAQRTEPWPSDVARVTHSLMERLHAEEHQWRQYAGRQPPPRDLSLVPRLHAKAAQRLADARALLLGTPVHHVLVQKEAFWQEQR